MRAAACFVLLCAGSVLGSCADHGSLVVVTVSATNPVSDIASLEATVTAIGSSRVFEIPLSEKSIPPEHTFAVDFGPSVTGLVSVHVEGFTTAHASVGVGDGSTSITVGKRVDLPIALATPPTGDMAIIGDLSAEDMASMCSDNIKDNGETDIDCGGPCPAKCAVDKRCNTLADCETASCVSGFCQLVSGPPFWLSVAPMPTGRDLLSAGVGDDGRVYAMGGLAAGMITTANEGYDPSSNTWSTAPAGVPAAVGFGAGYTTANDGQTYVMGGDTGSTQTNASAAYLASANKWTTIANLPTARFYTAGCLGTDGRVYVVGGRVGFMDTPAAEAYDVGLKTWSTLTPMPNARSSLAAATGQDGRIYAIAGVDNANGFTSPRVDAYDPGTNQWTQVASVSDARSGLAAVAAPDGRIYAIGGLDIGASGVVEAYTPATNTWVPAASLGTPRQQLAAVTGPDGRIYAIGGGNSLTTVEVYGPVPSVSPSSGKAGSLASISGTNFAANANVNVLFSSSTGTVLGTGTTNATGAIASPITVTIPTVAPAAYSIVVMDDRSQYPVAVKFTVAP